MPTGYTEILQRKPDIAFTEFAWRCARAMGACIMQRDDATDAPVNMDEQPSDYCTRAIANAESEIAWLESLSQEQLIRAHIDELRKSSDGARDAKRRKQADEQSYRRMLRLVNEWHPPTPDHQGLKDFMRQQIADSIKWDCDTSYYDGKDHEPNTSPAEALAWREERITELRKGIVYHQQKHAEEVERANARNAWKRQLAESVGMPGPLVVEGEEP